MIPVIYYASIIFQSLGLTSSTTSLLASGVIGIINVATTIPAIYYIDKVGRKPLMMIGSAGMCICELIIGVIVATCGHDWKEHSAAGWTAVGKLRCPKQRSRMQDALTFQQFSSGFISSILPTAGAQVPGF